MYAAMLVLGIDTTCDDTAAAVVEDGCAVRSNVVASQHELHAAFGGIVPEIASRAHTAQITAVIHEALTQAQVRASDLDAIAVSTRPGLVGSLLVGVSAAKSLAWCWDVPFVEVDHIHAHCVAARAEHRDLAYPFLALVASGGHTAIYEVVSAERLNLVTSTIDDAAGECFDKAAVLLGLPQPGGPQVASLARDGDPKAVAFPRSRVKGDALALSFSGLKTAVLYFLKGPGGKRDDPDRPDLPCTHADVAASLERAIIDVLIDRVHKSLAKTGAKRLTLGGGVGANTELRRLLVERAPPGVEVFLPTRSLCTDNGAMIAIRGHELLALGHRGTLDAQVFATGEAGIS